MANSKTREPVAETEGTLMSNLIMSAYIGYVWHGDNRVADFRHARLKRDEIRWYRR